MKDIICTFAIGALTTIGVIGLTTASSTAAHAQGQSKGVFVSSIAPGIITAISDNHITIKNIGGKMYDIIVEPNAQLLHKGSAIKLADVHIGDSLGAAGWLDGTTLRGVGLTVDDGKVLQSLFYNQKEKGVTVGKTFVLGNVTAIDNNKLTVKRTDQVVQVVEVDGSTLLENSGPRGLTSATLADVKVGSMISAVGGLKDNVFVAKKIYLMRMQ